MNFRRLFLWCLAGFLIVLAFRGGARFLEKRTPAPGRLWQQERLRGTFEALRRPPPSNFWILVLGPSDVEVALEPGALDRLLQEKGFSTTTYNFAVRDNGMIFPLYLERLALELKKIERKPDLILVKLDPSRFSTTSVRLHDVLRGSDGLPAIVFDTGLFFSSSLPMTDKLELAAQKWILGERDLQSPIYYARDIFSFPANLSPLPENKDLEYMIWDDSDLHPHPAWSPESRGSFFWNYENVGLERVEADITRYVREQTPERYLAKQEFCCGLLSMNFEEGAVGKLRLGLGSLRETGVPIALFEIPESADLQRSVEARARLENFYAGLRSEFSFPFIDLGRDGLFSVDDYMDPAHFNWRGRAKFNAVLGDRLVEAGLLKNQNRE